MKSISLKNVYITFIFMYIHVDDDISGGPKKTHQTLTPHISETTFRNFLKFYHFKDMYI